MISILVGGGVPSLERTQKFCVNTTSVPDQTRFCVTAAGALATSAQPAFTHNKGRRRINRPLTPLIFIRNRHKNEKGEDECSSSPPLENGSLIQQQPSASVYLHNYPAQPDPAQRQEYQPGPCPQPEHHHKSCWCGYPEPSHQLAQQQSSARYHPR